MAKLLSPSDIRGAWSIFPTPATIDANDWRATDTVDLDETARASGALIDAGIDGLLSMGTLGECATLTWPEKQRFMSALVDAVRGRVPVFVGTTALNTRDTIEQMRFARDIGATGTMLGLPMWCACSLDTAIQFYKDVAEAVPDFNIAVYANAEAFKFEFGRAFWARVADIPQVVTCKYSGIGALVPDLRLTRGKMKLLPLDFDYYASARIDDEIDAFWSSGAACGPSVVIRLRDLVAQARQSGDWSKAAAFSGRVGATAATLFPNGSFKDFSTYNISLEKARIDAAKWMTAGPVRPPYHLTPEPYLDGARRSGTLWAELDRSLAA